LVLAFEAGAASCCFFVVVFFFVVGAFTFFMVKDATFWGGEIAIRPLYLNAASLFFEDACHSVT
jgi:hypothetical protein